MFKVNNKDTRTMPSCFFGVCIVKFEHVIADREVSQITYRHILWNIKMSNAGRLIKD